MQTLFWFMINKHFSISDLPLQKIWYVWTEKPPFYQEYLPTFGPLPLSRCHIYRGEHSGALVKIKSCLVLSPGTKAPWYFGWLWIGYIVLHSAATDILPVCVASVIVFAVVCWGGGIGGSGTNKLNKLERKASSVVEMEPDSVEAEKRKRGKLQVILENPPRPCWAEAAQEHVQSQTHPAMCLKAFGCHSAIKPHNSTATHRWTLNLYFKKELLHILHILYIVHFWKNCFVL